MGSVARCTRIAEPQRSPISTSTLCSNGGRRRAHAGSGAGGPRAPAGEGPAPCARLRPPRAPSSPILTCGRSTLPCHAGQGAAGHRGGSGASGGEARRLPPLAPSLPCSGLPWRVLSSPRRSLASPLPHPHADRTRCARPLWARRAPAMRWATSSWLPTWRRTGGGRRGCGERQLLWTPAVDTRCAPERLQARRGCRALPPPAAVGPPSAHATPPPLPAPPAPPHAAAACLTRCAPAAPWSWPAARSSRRTVSWGGAGTAWRLTRWTAPPSSAPTGR